MIINLAFADSPYTLQAPEDASQVQVEEIYILCNTTGGDINIILPPTTDFGYLNPKIKFANVSGANDMVITPDATNVDLINGSNADKTVAGALNSAKLEMVKQGKTGDLVGMWQITPAV